MNEFDKQAADEWLSVRACAGKIAHANKSDAIVAMKRTRMQNKFLSVYRCEFCDQWHVGKNSSYRKSHKRVMRRGVSR